jgi:hypothetical protein
MDNVLATLWRECRGKGVQVELEADPRSAGGQETAARALEAAAQDRAALVVVREQIALPRLTQRHAEPQCDTGEFSAHGGTRFVSFRLRRSRSRRHGELEERTDQERRNRVSDHIYRERKWRAPGGVVDFARRRVLRELICGMFLSANRRGFDGAPGWHSP